MDLLFLMDKNPVSLDTYESSTNKVAGTPI